MPVTDYNMCCTLARSAVSAMSTVTHVTRQPHAHAAVLAQGTYL